MVPRNSLAPRWKWDSHSRCRLLHPDSRIRPDHRPNPGSLSLGNRPNWERKPSRAGRLGKGRQGLTKVWAASA